MGKFGVKTSKIVVEYWEVEAEDELNASVEEEQIKDEFKDMELRRILRDFLKDFDENLTIRRINELFSFMKQL